MAENVNTLYNVKAVTNEYGEIVAVENGNGSKSYLLPPHSSSRVNNAVSAELVALGLPGVFGLVSASQSAATANTTLLNTALATLAIVAINIPGTYYINSTLITKQGGNQVIALGEGVTIKLAPSSNCQVLKNWANANGTPITITSITANDWTGNGSLPAKGTEIICTAVTAAAHGLIVGDQVGIMWSGQQGFGGVFYVDTVADTTHFTYRPRLKPNVQTAPGVGGKTMYCIKADRNLYFFGPGTYDQDVANNGGITGLPAGYLHAIAYVNTIRYENQNFANSGERDIQFWCVDDFKVVNHGGTNGKDCIHCLGPVSNVVIDTVTGSYRDDVIVPMMREDDFYAAIQDSEGDIINFKAINIEAFSLKPMVSLYFFTNLYAMAGMEFDLIGGRSSLTAIKMVSTPSTGSTLQGVCKDIRIGKITTIAKDGLISIENITIDLLELTGLNYQTPQTNPLVNFISTSIIKKLIINKFNTLAPHNPPVTDFLFKFAGQIETLIFRDCKYDSTSSGNGYMVGFVSPATFGEMIIENLSGSIGWFMQITSAITSGKIKIDGLRSNGGLLQLDILGTVDIEHHGVSLTGATRFLNIRSTGVVTAQGDAPSLGGAVYAAIAAGGSLIPKSFGVNIDVSTSTINKSANNIATHTGATNPGIAYADGTNWKRLYDGAVIV